MLAAQLKCAEYRAGCYEQPFTFTDSHITSEMEDIKPHTSPTQSPPELLPPPLPYHPGMKAPSLTHMTCCWIQAFSHLLLCTLSVMSGLRIKQQNCRKSKTTALGFITIADPTKWDVILIQEPYIYPNSTLTIALQYWNVIYPPSS